MRASHRPWFAVPLLAAALLSSGAAVPPAPPRPKPQTAGGLIVDVQGRPVPGAAIEVSITGHDYRSVTIGSGTAAPDGRFSLSLSTNRYGDLGLGVEAPGFEPWGWAGYPQGITDERIVLRRKVDRAYLQALGTIDDPRERAPRVLEVAASDDLPDVEEMFPYLAGLRPDLLVLVRARTASPAVQRDGSTPADHAARLLAYWGEPADDGLLAPWLTREHGYRPVPPALTAPSILEVCGLWRTVLYRQEKVEDRPPWGACGTPTFDPSGLHALVLFQVRYAYWGYNMHLVMRREGDLWTLRRVAENGIQHYRPAD